MLEATIFRGAARAMFAPFGGLAILRRRALDSLKVGPGARVLEVGCGPGEMTSELLRRGAIVHAIDASTAMLSVARKRAPNAEFEHVDLRSYQPDGEFQSALMVFVLHELPVLEIPHVLAIVATSLMPGGRLVILDHAMPGGMRGVMWRYVLRAIESRTVDAWLALDLHSLLRRAGFVTRGEEFPAGGRAHLIVAELSVARDTYAAE